MSAKIITVFNQKGGVGKSTTALQLSGTLGVKHKTLLVDIDPQGTATISHSQAERIPFPADLLAIDSEDPKILEKLQEKVGDYEYMVIDCPPSATSVGCSAAMLVSDLVLVPVIPSPADIWAANTAIKLALKAKSSNANSNMPIYLLPTMVQPNSSLASAMIDHIADQTDIPLTRATLGLRTAYRDSMLDGVTVHHVSNNRKAVMEVNSLVTEVIRIIKKGK